MTLLSSLTARRWVDPQTRGTTFDSNEHTKNKINEMDVSGPEVKVAAK